MSPVTALPVSGPADCAPSAAEWLRIRQAELADAPGIAELHIQNLSACLGFPLIEAYYRGLLRDQSGFVICAELGGELIGYIGIIPDRRQLMRSMLSSLVLKSSAGLLTHPKLIPHVVARFCRWMMTCVVRPAMGSIPGWEYRPLVVEKQWRNHNVAQLLLAAADNMLIARGVREAFLFVSETNPSALRAYAKSGFRPLTLTHSSGVVMLKNLAVQTPAAMNAGPIVAPSRAPGLKVNLCPLCSSPKQTTILQGGEKLLKKCAQCGVRYLWPQPSKNDLSVHFEGESNDKNELERKFERNRIQLLARIANYIQRRRSGGTILDIGCATGLFLGRFFRAATWQRSAVELSQGAAEKARREGIRVHHGDIHGARLSNEGFDVITVLDTFCYFAQPQLELGEFRRILKCDGLLVIETPLATSRIWRASRPLGKLLSWSRYPLLESSDHLFYFTPKSISLLLEKCGFEVQTIIALPGNKHANGLRNLAFKSYFLFSLIVNTISRSRIFLAPRFLVVARKELADRFDAL